MSKRRNSLWDITLVVYYPSAPKIEVEMMVQIYKSHSNIYYD